MRNNLNTIKPMKRLFAFLVTTMAFVTTIFAQTTAGYFINNSVMDVQPPQAAPQIDATNFVNRNLFRIAVSTGGLPFDFSSTENFTNNSVMSASAVGFRFDTAYPQSGVRKRAKNFSNAGQINPGNASITAGLKLLINASNIVNRGLLQVGGSGVISLAGNKIEADRSTFQVGPASTSTVGLFDDNWGIGATNITPVANLNALVPVTPTHIVSSLQFFYTESGATFSYSTGAINTALVPPGVTAVQSEITGDSNRSVNIVFVRNTNPNITTTVRFSADQTSTRLAVPTVEWLAVTTNVVTGEIFTNRLYLTDLISRYETNALIEYLPNGVPPETYSPSNYNFSLIPPGMFALGVPGVTYVTPTSDYWSTNDPSVVTVISNAQYASYRARLSALTAEPPLGIGGFALKDLPGRVEIDADTSLALSLVQINAQNYVRINSTNHFVGATNASISVPIADIFLGSTNGMLNTENILLPTIPRFTGNVDLYSTMWTNTIAVPAGGTNFYQVLYQVLYVDSDLNHLITPQVNHLLLRSTNVAIAATFNISSNLTILADNLTINTNGSLNILSPWENLGARLGSLKNFTNNGSISAADALTFFGSGLATDGSDLPYNSFVNRGLIDSTGNTIWANYLESRGEIYAATGANDLTGGNVLLLPSTTSGLAALRSPNAEILINANNLTISNHLIQPGRSLSLWVTGHLADGYPAVTNRITTGDGFNLFTKPATGDLRYTVVTNTATVLQGVPNWWAGEDRGATNSGYTNNAALGKMVLSGAANSFFIFYPAGASNALYVGTLELTGSAALTNATGNLINVGVAPGMKIYYRYLRLNGVSVSPALLNGKNDGAFNFVSTYTGPDIATLSSGNSVPTIYDNNPDLKVTSGNPLGSSVIVSWNTIGGATNRLYYKNSIADPQWVELVNFVAGADGRVNYPEAVNAPSRVYKVELDLPSN